MKYAKLKIDIENMNDHNCLVRANLYGICKQSLPVFINMSKIKNSIVRHNKYITYKSTFMICHSCENRFDLGNYYLNFPDIPNGNADGSMNVTNLEDHVAVPLKELQSYLSKLIEALYFWDNRCARSVKVQPKMKEDFPIIINYRDEKIEVGLRQMLEFAEYIK